MGHSSLTQNQTIENNRNSSGSNTQRSMPAVPVFQKVDKKEELPIQGVFEVQKKAPKEEELPIQKKPNNTGLPDNLKSGVENLSGISMDDVKVHYNSSKPAQLQALAYAQGTDIHVAPGQEQHLPHEAWHVVQQKQGRVQPTMQMKEGVAVNDDKGLESEADVMGGKALQFMNNRSESIQINNIQNRDKITPISQLMAKNAAEGIVNTVKTAVPDAGNRLFDILATLGKSVDNNKIKIDVLNSINAFAPFGTTNIATIATRASVANVTKGAVCDNYQEMVIAEMDRSGVGVPETVRAESYPGHSYVSVVDPINPTDRNEDLIVDAWRNMVDKRKDFNFFTKYRNNYTPYGPVAMAGATNWLDPNITGNYYVRGFLNMQGINTGNLAADMQTYKDQNPGTISLEHIYPF